MEYLDAAGSGFSLCFHSTINIIIRTIAGWTGRQSAPFVCSEHFTGGYGAIFILLSRLSEPDYTSYPRHGSATLHVRMSTTDVTQRENLTFLVYMVTYL